MTMVMRTVLVWWREVERASVGVRMRLPVSLLVRGAPPSRRPCARWTVGGSGRVCGSVRFSEGGDSPKSVQSSLTRPTTQRRASSAAVLDTKRTRVHPVTPDTPRTYSLLLALSTLLNGPSPTQSPAHSALHVLTSSACPGVPLIIMPCLFASTRGCTLPPHPSASMS